MQLSFTSLWLSLCGMLLLGACSKEKPEEKGSQFEVLEAGTKIPLQGVRVDGYTCLKRDWIGSCIQEQFSATTITNSAGMAIFPSSANVSVIKASKEKYWNEANYFHLFGDPVTYLYPVATLKVRIIKTTPHPEGDRLYVFAQQSAYWNEGVVAINVGQPADTTLYLKGRGNYENDVLWNVKNGTTFVSHGNTPRVMVNGFDTAQLEIRY